jgi:hypothetical protein
MVTVIPYAFSAVLKQMEAVRAMEAAGTLTFTLHNYFFKRLVSAELAKSITEEPDVTQDGSHISNTTEL